MARKTIRVSDISGERIEHGAGARVRIVYDDPRENAIELDVRAEEIRDLAAKGRKARRRAKTRHQKPLDQKPPTNQRDGSGATWGGKGVLG